MLGHLLIEYFKNATYFKANFLGVLMHTKLLDKSEFFEQNSQNLALVQLREINPVSFKYSGQQDRHFLLYLKNEIVFA